MSGDFAETRRALHGVADAILAGTAARRVGWARLRVEGAAIRTPLMPGSLRQIEMTARGLRAFRARESSGVPLGAGHTAGLRGTTDRRFRWAGTLAQTAAAAGLTAEPPANQVVGSGLSGSDPLRIDSRHAVTIMTWFGVGNSALTRLSRTTPPDAPGRDWLLADTFTLVLTADGVSYGVSAGDWSTPEPFAFVSRTTGQMQRQPASALRSRTSLLAFFRAHA